MAYKIVWIALFLKAFKIKLNPRNIDISLSYATEAVITIIIGKLVCYGSKTAQLKEPYKMSQFLWCNFIGL